ncbi:fumarate reductase flavoC-term family protein [Mycobacterium kansasii]|uniref:Fumarate reductase flavoC-term family protein n=1 Tax=Mycobacterium kansasii TaxID=1768 RepID=A0A1V3WIA5_MYCKA|nr:fumarate reductase flavoC-term family protein [Mycobacterium kansasii]
MVRTADGLRRLSGSLAGPVRRVAGRRDFEDLSLAVAARVVAAAALARTESRGCHHRAEYPDATPEQARSIVVQLADDHHTVGVPALAAVG